jgi:tyrosyl-tRNA synthetase
VVLRILLTRGSCGKSLRRGAWQAGRVAPLLEDLTRRGLVHQMTDQERLPDRLDSGGLTVYIGFDPTADSLHVGHLQQLCLLHRFQEAGHQAIALVGGGTGMIGDPSGKSEERNLLSSTQLDSNRAAIAAQISAFLRSGRSEEPARGDGESVVPFAGGPLVVDNAEWLGSALLLEFLRDVGKSFSVNAMIRKDSVRARLEGREQSLSFTEFSYMLLQAWDFVQLYDRYGCELQLGGSDQWGNITEGVDLIRRMRGAQSFGLTSPLVTKSDGTKFGKTESGSVWLDPRRTSPYAFFQFWVRTGDADALSYLRRFTFLDRERIDELDAIAASRPGSRDAQRVLAHQMTAMVHGEEEARRAATAATVLFTPAIGELDEKLLESALADAPSTSVSPDVLESGLDLVDALLRSSLAGSKSEGRRLLEQGSIYVNGRRVEGRALGPGDALHGRWIVLRKGKARQHVLEIEALSLNS